MIRDPTRLRLGADDDNPAVVGRARSSCAIGTPAEHRLVDLSAALAADLRMLSATVQDSSGGLETRLESLVENLRGTISSYLGLTMTIALDGHEISFTLGEHEALTGASLYMPLPALVGAQQGSSLVLYAATPGAFVDLAADLAWVLRLEPSSFVLDGHLSLPPASESVVGLREHTAINRAIGALIDRGHSPESARTELRRHAERDGRSVPASAQRILDGLRRRPLPEQV